MRRALLAVVALLAALAVRFGHERRLHASRSSRASSASRRGTSSARTGRAWRGSNEAISAPIASITKLMTASSCSSERDLSDVVRVSPRAAGVGESTVYLRAGEELTVAALLRAMLVPSANDAAEALALHVGKGSTARFVALMNAKGATSSASPTRTSRIRTASTARGHVSSARDATLLVRYALGIPFIRDALDARRRSSLPGRHVSSRRRTTCS